MNVAELKAGIIAAVQQAASGKTCTSAAVSSVPGSSVSVSEGPSRPYSMDPVLVEVLAQGIAEAVISHIRSRLVLQGAAVVPGVAAGPAIATGKIAQCTIE